MKLVQPQRRSSFQLCQSWEVLETPQRIKKFAFTQIAGLCMPSKTSVQMWSWECLFSSSFYPAGSAQSLNSWRKYVTLVKRDIYTRQSQSVSCSYLGSFIYYGNRWVWWCLSLNVFLLSHQDTFLIPETKVKVKVPNKLYKPLSYIRQWWWHGNEDAFVFCQSCIIIYSTFASVSQMKNYLFFLIQ